MLMVLILTYPPHEQCNIPQARLKASSLKETVPGQPLLTVRTQQLLIPVH